MNALVETVIMSGCRCSRRTLTYQRAQQKQFPQEGFELEQFVIRGQGEGFHAAAVEEPK